MQKNPMQPDNMAAACRGAKTITAKAEDHSPAFGSPYSRNIASIVTIHCYHDTVILSTEKRKIILAKPLILQWFGGFVM